MSIESLSPCFLKRPSSSTGQERRTDLVVVTAESGVKLEQASAWHVSPSNFKQPRRLPTYFQPDHTLLFAGRSHFGRKPFQLETDLGLFEKALIPSPDNLTLLFHVAGCLQARFVEIFHEHQKKDEVWAASFYARCFEVEPGCLEAC